MKAKRFILMLLVMLMSVTRTLATVVKTDYTTLETDFTQALYGKYTDQYEYTCNSNQATMIIKTNSAIFLDKILVYDWNDWSATSPNSMKIEGSNDQSEWHTLTNKTLEVESMTLRKVSVSATEFYQYFRLTLYGSSSSIVIRALELYEDKLLGTGTSQDPYILDKDIYLKQYAALVDGGNNTACAKLTANIDMNGTDVASIDNASFTGTIDGNGYTIKNLNIANGLFKNIGAATIKNLTLENATLSATGENGGAFASQANGTIFQNCIVKGTISASSTNKGGLVGKAVGCQFTECSVNGLNATGTNVGGLAGITDNSTYFTNCNVLNFSINDAVTGGGLVGNASGTSFTNCLVLSYVTAVGSTTVGGLAGKTTNNATFTNCYSVGNYSIESANAGALVGYAQGSTTFNQCYAATNLDDGGEIRPTFVSSTNTGSYQNQPAQNLVDNGGVDTRWIADKSQMVGGIWNIVVTTGRATQLESIKLWNANNQDYPKRRWKSMKVYGSASSDDGWTEIGAFQDLQLAANNKGLAGEVAINAIEKYAYYRIDVLDNEGDNYMQMSDMKFVVSTQHQQDLPVCGSSDGSCTANLCYHYGNTSSVLSSAVSRDDITSGRLAYLLNGSVDYATGPYYQKLGTDIYPILTGNYYVYQSIDGNSYTNTCPHHNNTLVKAYKPMTCFSDGNAAYYHCSNPACKRDFFENGEFLTKATEATLSDKPVIVENHTYMDRYPGLGYTESISKNGTTYYNVTTLYVWGNLEMQGDYIVTYTNLRDESSMTFHEFYYVDENWNNVSENMRYYVNGVERTSLKHSLTLDDTHKEIVIDNLKKYDIIKIVYSFGTTQIAGKTHLYIAQEKPTGWNGKHSFHQVAATYDCVEGGYDQHYECKICENPFNSNADANSDNNLVPLSTYYHAPLPGGHTFALSDQLTDEGLLKYTCQTTNCKAHDPNHFMIPSCIGTAGVEVTTDGETYSATADNVTIDDGNSYNSPVPFEIGSLSYNRYYPENVWSAWCTPFDVNASYLSANGLTPAYIEGIHNYDDNEDGTIDRTVMEIVKISNGRLLAGTPLLVRAAQGYSTQLELSDVTMKTNDDIQSLQSSTTTSTFNFIGTYAGTTAAAADNIYSLNNSGAMVHRTGTILPLRWYCQIEQKPSFIGEETPAPAHARAIYIKVIGEEDQTTGIRTLYDEADQTLERADGIFDLSGRKLSVPQHGKINIINGKKQFVR